MSDDEQMNPDENLNDSATEESVSETNVSENISLEKQVESLTAELEQALNDVAIHKDHAIRAKAESENIRRRAEREVSNASKFGLEKFAKELLALVDSLEKALEIPAENDANSAIREGIELTYKLFVDTLNKFSVEQINPVNESFDPELHEAMVMQESDEHESNTVMHVVQMGYSLNGRLIRPARVVVSKGKPVSIDEKV